MEVVRTGDGCWKPGQSGNPSGLPGRPLGSRQAFSRGFLRTSPQFGARPRTIDDDQVAAVIERTLRTTPADATHWSIRSMAAETGFSHTTIRRMWAAFGLQPHRSQTFRLSNDPLFVDKVRDIVELDRRCSPLEQPQRLPRT